MKQVPALAVLAYIVVRGMAFLRERDAAFAAASEARQRRDIEHDMAREERLAKTLEAINADVTSVQRDTNEALRENTRALGGNQETLRDLGRLIREYTPPEAWSKEGTRT